MMKSTFGATVSEAVVQTRRFHRFADSAAMQADVVGRVARLALECIRARGAFRIVLAGGNTPQAVYRELKNIKTDWSAWHIYFGDERCLPLGDAGRNDTMALATWLAKVPVPPEQIHLIPAELGAEAGARRYQAALAGVDSFDLVLLGLGEDGHTASLFPGHSHTSSASVLAVHDAPKAPPERISLSNTTLSQGDQVWFLVSGEGKREALTQWLHGTDLPASTIRPRDGVDIFTDVQERNA
jgi:6-phosphogluconolactonase